jgi:hypothetical protein
MRKASVGPVAFAALLTVFASVGLHPEPAGSRLAAFAGAPQVQKSGDAVRSSGSHDCQICLTHRTAPLTSLQYVVFDRGSALFSPDRETPSVRSLALPLLSDGRAPPSA